MTSYRDKYQFFIRFTERVNHIERVFSKLTHSFVKQDHFRVLGIIVACNETAKLTKRVSKFTPRMFNRMIKLYTDIID